jgi:hypothetical protein
MTMHQNQRAVGEHEPVMVAWKAYKQTDDYANTLSWAGKHCEGELWAAFSTGFALAHQTAEERDGTR